MKDARLTTLAKNLVNFSVSAKKGDKVLIETFDIPDELICELVNQTYAAGARPFLQINRERVRRAVIAGADDEQLKIWADHAANVMKDMDCYIGVRGANNSYELSDVKMDNYMRLFSHPVHHDIRVKKTRWVVLRYPTASMAQLAGMSTEAFEDFYFNVCNLDYAKMERAMTPLVNLLQRTDRVRITAKDTDLSFSIKGIPAVKCSGRRNIPDGEVYTAPVKTSVNGRITYNAPSIENGIRFENVSLLFKDGKIVDATSNFTDKCNEIFNTDEGARYVGEFAIGVNPYITKAMGDILFDEKISGSIHFTPGASYDEAFNGNVSALHWDLVLIQTPEFGGGQIYFDNVLIRDNGRFVIKELEGLNPENLK